jgi:hypothetical protein
MPSPHRVAHFALFQLLRDHYRTAWGLLGTLLWVVGYCRLTLHLDLGSMTPNMWGDWAAGLAAPIAFLWLVLGYFQQGEELRLQVRELNASVEQQTALVAESARHANLVAQSLDVAKRSAEAAVIANRPWITILELEPVFVVFPEGGTAGVNVNIVMRNAGNSPAYQLKAHSVVAACGRGRMWDIPKMASEAREMADGLLDQTFGEILFPGERTSEHHGMIVRSEDVSETVADSSPPHLTNFIVVVCLTYRFANGGQGRTERVFMLHARSKGGNDFMPFLLSEKEFGPEQMKCASLPMYIILE